MTPVPRKRRRSGSGQARVDVLSGSQFAPGSALVEKSVQQVLQQGLPTVEFYAEHLDANRFPEERHYRLFREYLQEKYAQNPPEVIVAFLITKFELAGRLPAELFPGIPVVVGALTEEEVPREGFGNHVTGVVQRIDFAGALELILKLQPETERIVVIGGTAPLDRRYLSRTEEAARSIAGRVQFEYWTTYSVAEMREAVASLPPGTVIFFTTVFRDATGKTFLPAPVASMLAVSSSVPVYVVADSLIARRRGGRSGCAISRRWEGRLPANVRDKVPRRDRSRLIADRSAQGRRTDVPWAGVKTLGHQREPAPAWQHALTVSRADHLAAATGRTLWQ